MKQDVASVGMLFIQVALENVLTQRYSKDQAKTYAIGVAINVNTTRKKKQDKLVIMERNKNEM